MTFEEAEAIRKMIDGHWNLRMDDRTADLWLAVLLPEDAQESTHVVAYMAKRMHYAPKIVDFREVMRLLTGRGEEKVARVSCSTCNDDRFVVVGLRPAEKSSWVEAQGIEQSDELAFEEMAPCPDCNSEVDGEFTRGTDGSRMRMLDPATVRERMRRATPSAPSKTVPEWVWVWSWARWHRDPPEERGFPQQVDLVEGPIMSQAEYDALLAEWEEAGSPKEKSPLPVALGS